MDSLKAPAARRRLLLLLIYAPGISSEVNEPIWGITRLQKLLFLAKQETRAEEWLQIAYDFAPYRFGPYSSELYDDIEYLESFDILVRPRAESDQPVAEPGKILVPSYLKLEAKKRAKASSLDVVEARLEYEDLFEDDVGDSTLNQEFESRSFKLTPYGLGRAQQALHRMSDLSTRVMGALTEIKRKYNSLTLRTLLRQVYSRYPDWTHESEISGLL